MSKTLLASNLLDEVAKALNSKAKAIEPTSLEPIQFGEEVVVVLSPRLQRLYALSEKFFAEAENALPPNQEALDNLPIRERRAVLEKARRLTERHEWLDFFFWGAVYEEYGPPEKNFDYDVRAGFVLVKSPIADTEMQSTATQQRDVRPQQYPKQNAFGDRIH